MGKKVKSLSIKAQTGSSGTYFASWDFSPPTVITNSKAIFLNKLVKIKAGSKFYNGVEIPQWVMNSQWYVSDVSGDRAVLGKDPSGTYDIQSPINTKNITPVSGASVVEKSTLDHYVVKWYYATGDGVWFDGGSSNVTLKNHTYSAPSNAKKIKVSVKPVSKTYKLNNKDVSYWTGTAVTKTFLISNSPPDTPSVPTVTIEKYKLTASIENISDSKTDKIEFKVYKGNKAFKSGIANVKTARASYTCTINAGEDYRVRCRAINVVGKTKLYSDWSEYSSSAETIPATPSSEIDLKALSETIARVDWLSVKNATKYEVQYTDKRRYFDSSSEVKSQTVDAKVSHCEITGLETGKEWFFRVRAINDAGESGWTSIVSIILGKEPSPPTTWSSTTTAISGEPLMLYWVHNSEDGSSQTYAQIQFDVEGSVSLVTVKNTTDEDEKDKTSSYTLDTSKYSEGAKIKWRVRTKGVLDTYSDWSIQRTIDVYAPPTLELNVTDVNGDELDTLTTFPFYIKGTTGPDTQSPIGYSISIAANDAYDTTDNVGNETRISEGEVIYSKYLDTTEQLSVELLPSDIDLEDGIEYTITCVVSMNSGLTAEATATFNVSWVDAIYEPDAGVSIDDEQLVAYVKPYCVDDNDDLIEDVLLSVYRREYNGAFTELATGLSNTMDTTVTDPHPALDYARYRVVAISQTTGAVSYYDVPGYPVNEKAIIVQWDEVWSNFDTTDEDELEEPPWSGSLLRLPYNIDISNSHKQDVSLVEYVGREHPVSYYGTQLGETAVWSVEIEKTDVDTLYALRRLAKWMGDVYVREPSGSGYWANVTVSFSQTHAELTIPVTMNITRVEGGA